jgi:hypothetical protein
LFISATIPLTCLAIRGCEKAPELRYLADRYTTDITLPDRPGYISQKLSKALGSNRQELSSWSCPACYSTCPGNVFVYEAQTQVKRGTLGHNINRIIH